MLSHDRLLYKPPSVGKRRTIYIFEKLKRERAAKKRDAATYRPHSSHGSLGSVGSSLAEASVLSTWRPPASTPWVKGRVEATRHHFASDHMFEQAHLHR